MCVKLKEHFPFIWNRIQTLYLILNFDDRQSANQWPYKPIYYSHKSE